MQQIISAYRGRKLVMRSIYSLSVNLNVLKLAWEANECRVTIIKRKNVNTLRSPTGGFMSKNLVAAISGE